MATVVATGKKSTRRGRKEKHIDIKTPGSAHETSFSSLQNKLQEDGVGSEGSNVQEKKKRGLFSVLTNMTRNRNKVKGKSKKDKEKEKKEEIFELSYEKKNRPTGFKEPVVDNPLLGKNEERRNTLDGLEETEVDVLNDVSKAIGGPKFELTRGRDVCPSVLQSVNMGNTRQEVVPSILMERPTESENQKPKQTRGRKMPLPSVFKEQEPIRNMPSVIANTSTLEPISPSGSESNFILGETSSRKKKKRRKKRGATKSRPINENIVDLI